MAPPWMDLPEDPFDTMADRSSSVSIPIIPASGTADSAEDANGDTTHPAGLSLFGHAHPYQRRSSAVKMPSSPSSRNLKRLAALQGSPRPQRAPNSSLNASAAPWHPTDGPAQSRRSTRKLGTRPSHDDARLITTPPSSQKRYSRKYTRRAAWSDPPFCYPQRRIPMILATPSPGQVIRIPENAYGHYYRSLHTHNAVQSQPHPTNHTCSGMPQQREKNTLTNDSMHLASDHMLKSSDQVPYHGDQNGDTPQVAVFDSYTSTPSIQSQTHAAPPAQINPYSQDGNAIGSGAYFPASTNYPQQVISLLCTAALYTH